MDKTTLYRFFEGVTSFEEEEAIKKWMEESIENKKAFIKERKLFDAMLLLGEKVKITGIKRLSSLRTTSKYKSTTIEKSDDKQVPYYYFKRQ